MNIFNRLLVVLILILGPSACWKASYNGVKYESYDAALAAVKQDISTRLAGVSLSEKRTANEIIVLIPSDAELASLYSDMQDGAVSYYVSFYKEWVYGYAEALKRKGYFSKIEIREGESPDFIQLDPTQRLLYIDLDSTVQSERRMRNSAGADEKVNETVTGGGNLFESFTASVMEIDAKWSSTESSSMVASRTPPDILPDVARGNRYALVVGNARYKSVPLLNPANDARAMAAMLSKLGFEVDLRLDVSLSDFDRSIDLFYGKLAENKGVGLFYYAGHGLQVDGENYLVPVDAVIRTRSDVRYKCLNAGRVLGKMEDAGNPTNIIILDACRNNPLTRGLGSGMAGFNRMDAPQGAIIAYSTAPGSVSSDGNGDNGVYTKHLIKNMDIPGLDLNSIFIATRSEVLKETAGKQVPWESSSLTGKFYFRNPEGQKK
ncbi:caspase family protein [Maridesulfovibrio sp.]|uniref:caspase family protein n=1 Tax=Maridesulfovibrio sp. TaxID=2795000 RepID=UPI002A18E5B9|nr:caspase family protein [Maridesulfovibrio sp.]